MAPVSGGHETRTLFVPRQDQLDLGRARQAVEEIEILLAGDAENIFDPLFLEAIDEQVGCFFHACRPLKPRIKTMRPQIMPATPRHHVVAAAPVVGPRVPAASRKICNEGGRGCHAGHGRYVNHRHCERSEAIQSSVNRPGLLRSARNDGDSGGRLQDYSGDYSDSLRNSQTRCRCLQKPLSYNVPLCFKIADEQHPFPAPARDPPLRRRARQSGGIAIGLNFTELWHSGTQE